MVFMKLVFQVVSISTSLQHEGVRVQLSPLPFSQGGSENISLFKGSPNASFELIVNTPEGIAFFQLGKRYDISIDSQ